MSKSDDSKTAAETLESVLAFVRRSFMFWKRSTLVFMVVALASIPGVFLKPRIYRSEVVVLYQENIKAANLTGGESDQNARRVGARLREMLLSRASLEPIVRDVPRYAALADRRGLVDAVEELRGHIGFKAREGDAFEIGYEAPDPKEAQEVTRRLGDRIVQEAATARNAESQATKDYLEAQSKANKTKTDEAQAALSSFLSQHPEFQRFLLPGQGGAIAPVPGVPGAFVAVAPPPGTKDPVLFGMQSELAGIERQLKAGRDGPVAPAPAPQAREESQDVKDARANLARLKSQGLTDQHPDMAAAKRQLDAAIAADARRAPVAPPPTAAAPTGKLSDAERDQLEARARDLRRQIAAHRAGHPEPKSSAPATPSGSVGAAGSAVVPALPANTPVALEVEFRRLQREVETLKENQRQLDDKLFKASITADATKDRGNVQVKILDPAYLPAHPISKPRSTMLAMYLVAGMVLAIVLALVSARLDDRIYQRADLEILDILPVVGVIPRAGDRARGRAR